MTRSALVWNYDDNNFTWADASVVLTTVLDPAVCMQYGFDMGWQTTYADFTAYNTTYAELEAGTDPWSLLAGEPARYNDFYAAGTEQNLYWLTPDGVYKADQVIEKSGVKSYFAERTRIDMDDINPELKSNSYKQIKQVYPLLQSPSDVLGVNEYEFTIGWSNNLMDLPNYSASIHINLQRTFVGGRHKIDVRETGRYLAMMWDFTYTDEIAMTGADVDASELYGR